MTKALEGKIPLATELFTDKGDPNLSKNRLRDVSLINSIVLHTTGWGPGHERVYKRWKNKEITKKEFGYIYTKFQSRLQYNPHGTIAPTGELYQFAPLKYTTYHTASGKSRRNRYRTGKWKKIKSKPMDWWFDRFPDLDNPTELPCWEPIKAGRKVNYSINTRTVAYDLIPWQGGYTEAQYEKLAEVCAYTLHELNIPLDKKHLCDHSEVAPIQRTTRNGPWDFANNFDWKRFWSLLDMEYSLYRGAKDIPFKEDIVKSMRAMLFDLGYYVDQTIVDVMSRGEWNLADEAALSLFKNKNNISNDPSSEEVQAVSREYLTY